MKQHAFAELSLQPKPALTLTPTQVQSLVYIRVKQHAFAEIAETTFRHLLGLSLDWHLRKKMGEVSCRQQASQTSYVPDGRAEAASHLGTCG